MSIKDLLENESPLEIDKVLILNAKDFCLREDFRLATLDAVIALETVLYKYIREQGKKVGITNEDIERFIRDVGLTGNIKVVLKLLTKGLAQLDDDTLGCCKGAITTRNDIVHRGLIEVPPKETEIRIVCIEKMISYLKRLLQSD